MVKIETIYELTPKDSLYPESLITVRKKVKKLYAMGNLEILKNKSIAIVGTRNNTEYGEKYTRQFATQLSALGITIVSGLALGIDSIAHKGSMANKGRTIAVIGSGFNNIYPEENKWLFEEILKNNGCILSEYEPNKEVEMSNFPNRNRIIAGLSKGILVTEAKYRSGSSITARYGFKQEKPVFCIPNRLGEKTGVGISNLVKIGAKIVTNVNDILEAIGEETVSKEKLINIEKQLLKEEKERTKGDTIKRCIAEEYMDVYKALQVKSMDINELAKNTNESIKEINQKLTLMEIEGIIEILPGNLIQIKEQNDVL